MPMGRLALQVTEPRCVVLVQGLGGAGDYVVSSQIKDHALVFHKWGKTQPLFKVRESGVELLMRLRRMGS